MSKEIQIQLDNGLCFAGKTWGDESKPPLLALHGWLDNANSFETLAPYLKQHYHIIAIDLIGHGLTDHLPDCCHYHFTDSVDHVLSIAAKLGFETFSLMGHSMGACVAPVLAGTFPEKVGRLILLEGIGPLIDTADHAALRLRKYLKLSQRGRRIRSYETIEEAINTRVKNSAMTYNSAKLIVTRGMKEKDDLFFWRHDARLLYPSGTRFTEGHIHNFLQNIQCETTLVWAEHGLNIPKDFLAARQKQIKKLSISQIPGGHHAHMDYPEQVANIILS